MQQAMQALCKPQRTAVSLKAIWREVQRDGYEARRSEVEKAARALAEVHGTFVVSGEAVHYL